jgi:hypothetical protein
LSTHQRLGLPSGLFPSGIPTNILYVISYTSLSIWYIYLQPTTYNRIALIKIPTVAQFLWNSLPFMELRRLIIVLKKPAIWTYPESADFTPVNSQMAT